MPTTNPRVNVTLSPSLDQLVERFAHHQRASKSQVLRELLEAAEPALQRAVALMDAASKAGPGVLAGLADSMIRAQERVEDVLAGSLYRIEQGEDLVARAEAVKGRRQPARTAKPGATGGSAPPNPPASNRGVKSGTKDRRQGPTPARSRGRQ